MSRYSRLLIVICSLTASSLLSTTAYALPDDHLQSIELQADKSSFDQKNGIIVYAGQAQLKQGSLVITADKIVVHYSRDKNVEAIEATGTPARLQQQPNIDQELITASANKIVYSHHENTVELFEQAQLTQAGATMRGHKIHYDLAHELVRAEGGDSTENQRIKMTIPASTLTP